MVRRLQRASQMTRWQRICPSIRETRVQSLGREDPLEKEVTTRSNILAWKSHGERSLAGYSPWTHKEPDPTERLNHRPCRYICRSPPQKTSKPRPEAQEKDYTS